MRWSACLLCFMAGCDDYIFGEIVVDDQISEEGFGGVQQVVDQNCLGCHSAETALGELDLQSDLYGATVGVVGGYSIPIVLPRDPDNSMLYLKVVNMQPPYTGSDMPPGSGGLTHALAEVVRRWIEDGAPDASGMVPTPTDTGT